MSATQRKATRNDSQPAGMVVPRHGHGLLKPIQKGEVRNPGGRGGEYRETIKLAREHSVAAMLKMIALMDCSDKRVALIAQQAVLERGWGKPKDYDPSQDRPDTKYDLSSLSLAERRHLLAMMDRTMVVNAAPPEAREAEAQRQVLDAAEISERKVTARRTAKREWQKSSLAGPAAWNRLRESTPEPVFGPEESPSDSDC